ncbi:hypothetical protein ACWGDE_06570 [Streptomyces sp. NPDC054956]
MLIADQAVRAAVDEMFSLTYGMRQPCATREELSVARGAAKDAEDAEDAFVDAAARCIQGI